MDLKNALQLLIQNNQNNSVGQFLQGLLNPPQNKKAPTGSNGPVRATTSRPVVNTEVMRQNLLDQTPYTPQAAAYIKSLPVKTFGQEPVSSIVNSMAGGFYRSGDGTVNVNTQNFNPDDIIQLLRHEYIHAMDGNVNGYPGLDVGGVEAGMSYPQTGANTIDSYGFFPDLQKTNPTFSKMLDKYTFSSPLYKGNDTPASPQTKDIESIAYYGQKPLQAMLRSPEMAKFYSNVYIPMSKAMNYSPVYQAPERNMRIGRMVEE